MIILLRMVKFRLYSLLLGTNLYFRRLEFMLDWCSHMLTMFILVGDSWNGYFSGWNFLRFKEIDLYLFIFEVLLEVNSIFSYYNLLLISNRHGETRRFIYFLSTVRILVRQVDLFGIKFHFGVSGFFSLVQDLQIHEATQIFHFSSSLRNHCQRLSLQRRNDFKSWEWEYC